MDNLNKKIKVRVADHNDSEVIFDWRNDELTRQMFRDSEKIEWYAHSKWLDTKLQNPNCCILMCYKDQATDIGVVRFDIENNYAELSLNLSPNERGKKLAPICLSLAVNFFEKEYSSINKLTAEIKTSNIASKKSFEKVGFKIDYEKDGYFHLSALINS